MGEVTEILCDVDGVVADFVSAACTTHHRAVPNPYPPGEWDLPKILGLNESDFWRPLDNAEFWSAVPKYAAADSFVARLLALNRRVTFCTIPSRSPGAASAKIAWIRQHFGPVAEIIICYRKDLLARPGTLLVDDSDTNVTAYRRAGGPAILFPRPWNSRHAEANTPNLYANVLCEIENAVFFPPVTKINPVVEVEAAPVWTPRGTEFRVVDPATGGQKGTKLARYDLIPPDVLEELAQHYGKNCKEHGGKYDARNWERGYPWSLSFAALMRHGMAFWNGEDLDPEQKSKHVIAAAWHCFSLAWFMDHYPAGDDRPGKKASEEARA